MRCDASELCVGRAASDVRGGLADRAAPPTSAIAAQVAIAQPLAEGLTRRLVEEVQVLGVDRDPHRVAEAELDVGRERRDEVRARADDALLVLCGFRERLVDRRRLAADLAGVDPEVRHRLASQGFDELDARRDRRHALVPLCRTQDAGAEADDYLPAVELEEPRVLT